MKKQLAWMLILCICLSIIGCSKSTETADPAAEEFHLWQVTRSADEFGDVSEDSPLVLQSVFFGTYTNAAVTDGKLSTNVYFAYNEDNRNCYVVFRLFELTEHLVQSTSEDNVILKTKIDGEVSEYTIEPEGIQGDKLILGYSYDWMNYDGNKFVAALYSGHDIKCVLYINDAQYNFTVKSDNFKKAYDQPNVGKLQLPGVFAGKWAYSSGDATVFSRAVSQSSDLAETKELDIQFDQPITPYGNPYTLIVKDSQNNLEDEWTVSYQMSYIQDHISINTTTGYAQRRTIELREDKTLVVTITYYQGEPADDYNTLEDMLDDSSVATTTTCEFTRIEG